MDTIKRFFNNPIVKMIRKVISWILLLFLVLLASILIYYVVSSKIYELKGKNYEPKISLYTIISPSMEPNINVYDVVVTVKTDPTNIKEGDVITFISTSTLGEGLTITHRVKSVIKTDGDIKFRTQGDNNPIPDSALASSSNVLGKVVFKIPMLGYIQFFLQSKSGWLFALLIPAIIVVIYDILKVMRLSSIKQKVQESIKEEEKDPLLVKKQEELKQDLEKKYSKAIKKKDKEEKTPKKKEKTIKKEKSDKSSTNQEEDTKEETVDIRKFDFDLDDDIKLPKTKK